MKKMQVILGAVIVVLLVAFSCFFVVKEGQQAIVTQFGKPVAGPYKEAGLYLKIPIIQDVHMFDKRILKWDGKQNEIPTLDKKFIWVAPTARWRIADPLLFLQSVATEAGANSRLDDIIDAVVRDMISSHILVELVRSADWNPDPPPEALEGGLGKRSQDALFAMDNSTEPRDVKIGRGLITRNMLRGAGSMTPNYGIELIDVQVKRINFIDTVQKQVFERMISERKRIASQYRSEGEGESKRILGSMEKELARIRSEAYRRSQEIRGQADAQATDIFGKAFGQDPEFYALFKSLENLGNASGSPVEYILSTDSDLFKYLKQVPADSNK